MTTLHRGSILESKADYIVNPANSFLRHGAGLAKVIADAAAPKDSAERKAWWREQRIAPLIATGNACMTTAGALPYRGIIHAVGPVWNGGSFYERSLLISAYHRALDLAERAGGKSVAFPAISAGLFGFPISSAAIHALYATRQTPLAVEFWLFSDQDFAAFEEAMSAPGQRP